MEQQSQIPPQPQLVQPPPTPVLTSPLIKPKHTSRKILKIIGMVVLVIVVIFIALAWYGFYLQKQDKTKLDSLQSSQNPIKEPNHTFATR